MTIILIGIIIIGSLIFFYLKCSLMQSLMMLWSAVLATIAAFSFYETLANQFLSRGYAMDWALFACFIVSFIVSFGVFRVGLDFLIPSGVDLGNPVKITAAVVCGLMTGIIIAGNLMVGMGLFPKQGKLFYSRFDPNRSIVISNPKKSFLNVDGFVTGLYRQTSSGSMRSDKSFSVLHTDFLSQIHLNKLKSPEVLSITMSDALKVPSGKDQKPVRYVEDREGDKYTIVRVKMNKREVGSKETRFFPAQIRLVAKESPIVDGSFSGSAEAFYAAGFWNDGVFVEKELSEVISADSLPAEGQELQFDVAFQLPDGLQPVLLQYKNNVMVDLSSFEVVESTSEIEQALDGENQEKTDNS